MRTFPAFARMSLALLLLSQLGCAASRPDQLYRDLGEHAGITAIVEGMLVLMSENPRIAHHFAETDIVNLRDKLVEQFCVEAGGPCVYTGTTMDVAHAGLNVSESDFNALVEDLQRSMETQKVSISAQNRLLARLAPMQRDILHR
ncbi:MAG: group I truncated hemoglobin [Pseudomarimonas sp.]